MDWITVAVRAINSIGEIVTVQLEKGKSNAFSVTLYDDKGNALTTGVAQTANLEALDNAMGDWSITLLVSEV